MKRIAFGILMLAAGIAAGQLGLTMSSIGHGLVAVYYVVTGLDDIVTTSVTVRWPLRSRM